MSVEIPLASKAEDVFKRLQEIQNKLITENNSLIDEIVMKNEKKILVEKEIVEASNCLKDIRNQVIVHEAKIEMEKLKKKNCSDDIKEFYDLYSREIKSSINALEEKIQALIDETQIQVELFKSNKQVKITFLSNDQEIYLDLSNPQDIKIATEKFCDELVDNEQKRLCFEKRINDYNESNKQEKAKIADVIKSLRDICEF